jgi:hypothetical protein
MRWVETLEVNPALAPDPSRPGRASAWPIKARDNKPAAAIVIACVVLIAFSFKSSRQTTGHPGSRSKTA